MKLQDQVCTLEQGKILKKLGVLQSSFFSWFGDESHTVMDAGNKDKDIPMSVSKWVFLNTTEPCNNQELDHRDMVQTLKNPIASAFTVAELGVMLPSYALNKSPIKLENGMWYNEIIKSDKWANGNLYCSAKFVTQAVAMADLLIYLLENNLIELSEVNKKLNK